MTPNPQQQEVVDHFEGPCVVTAVPGSGKTASVTMRTARLLKRGVNPSSILSITFTNKAADEMRSRITKEVGKIAEKMTICTFHSLCVRMIREHAEFLGYTRKFSIYDSEDQWRAIKGATSKILGGEDEHPKVPDSYFYEVLNHIEGRRNADVGLERALERWPLVNEQLDVVEEYYRELKRCDSIDFTGLLSEALRLLRARQDVAEKYQMRWRFISVDEVQDTNIAQYEIIKLIGAHGNVMCVGDQDQGIYAFRNAEPENLASFERDFKARSLKLETNYRSTPQILERAHALIVNNESRKDAELKTGNSDGPPPRAFVFENDMFMAQWVAKTISKMIEFGESPKEIAVFYRVNFVSRILESSLRHAHIPFQVYGDVGFFRRMEVKAALAVLRLLSNPNDKTAFETVASMCCRGVGPKTCMQVYQISEDDNCSIVKAVQKVASRGGRMAKTLGAFASRFNPKEKPYDVLSTMLHKTSFADTITKKSTPDNDRLANVKELILEVQQHMASGGTLEDYLQFVSLLTSQDDKDDRGKVKLMTMHKSKGLEFDNVIITHANDEIIPHRKSYSGFDDEQRRKQMEEERRLMYVAMTRARRRLLITSCKLASKRTYLPSPFINEAGVRIFEK